MDARGDAVGLPRISESVVRLLRFLGDPHGTIIGLRFDVLLSDPATSRTRPIEGMQYVDALRVGW